MSSLKMTSIIGMVFFTLLVSPVFAGNVAAKKNGVKVYAEASKASKVLQTLKKGDVLETSKRKGMYWQVKLSSGDKGYVSFLKVKRKASKSSKSISKAIREAAVSGREKGASVNNSRVRSAVMGVRGLDESNDVDFASNVKPELRAVYVMEDLKVSAKSIRRQERKVMSEVESIAAKRNLD